MQIQGKPVYCICVKKQAWLLMKWTVIFGGNMWDQIMPTLWSDVNAKVNLLLCFVLKVFKWVEQLGVLPRPAKRHRRSTPLAKKIEICDRVFRTPEVSEPGKSNDKPVMWHGKQYETRRLTMPIQHAINKAHPDHIPKPKRTNKNPPDNPKPNPPGESPSSLRYLHSFDYFSKLKKDDNFCK